MPEIASSIFGRKVVVPPPGEYVANGAARQAAWALTGQLPDWEIGDTQVFEAKHVPDVFAKYQEVVSKTQNF